MKIEDRLTVGKILIAEFGRLAGQLDPYDEQLPDIIKRALMTQLKMKAFYDKWDKPPQMLEQLDQMDLIIKRLEQIQNKHVTDM
jgi:hypothetical protein